MRARPCAAGQGPGGVADCLTQLSRSLSGGLIVTPDSDLLPSRSAASDAWLAVLPLPAGPLTSFDSLRLSAISLDIAQLS